MNKHPLPLFWSKFLEPWQQNIFVEFPFSDTTFFIGSKQPRSSCSSVLRFLFQQNLPVSCRSTYRWCERQNGHASVMFELTERRCQVSHIPSKAATHVPVAYTVHVQRQHGSSTTHSFDGEHILPTIHSRNNGPGLATSCSFFHVHATRQGPWSSRKKVTPALSNNSAMSTYAHLQQRFAVRRDFRRARPWKRWIQIHG